MWLICLMCGDIVRMDKFAENDTKDNYIPIGILSVYSFTFVILKIYQLWD